MGSVAAIGIVAAVVVLSMAALVAWRGGTFGAVLAALLAADDDDVPAVASYYTHYPGFLAPVAALVVAGGSTLLLGMLDGRAPRPVTVGAAVLVVVLLVGVGGGAGGPPRRERPGPDRTIGAQIAGLVPGDACLTADDPTWILVAGRSPTSGGGAAPDRRPVRRARPARDRRRHGPLRVAGREMLLSDASQEVLVGYLERCPYVVVGGRDGRLDGRAGERVPGQPPR